MHRTHMSTTGLLMAGGILVLSITATPTIAGPPDGVALVLGATIHPADDSFTLPHPLSPKDLVRTSVASPGLYDIWFYLFSRRPLVGAWTVDFALEFDRRPGHGIDIEWWESLAHRAAPHQGWPDAGPDHGIRLEWIRPDCFDAAHRDLLAGRDGWFRQSALRLRVRVHGPDALYLADPEPGVRAQLVQCFDDAFRLDGEDGWTRYDGPVFTAVESANAVKPVPEWQTPVRTITWGDLKTRMDFDGRRP
ncbi:MAG: hypothetical protein SGI90_06520 [Candidatus Eisenbacteria bacterium]|nr:hypothetical protein [Candidatus Eisenbacteria bacterium]